MRRLVQWGLSAVLQCMLVLGLQAQASRPLSLPDALRYAAENGTRVKQAQLEARRGDQQVREVLASGLPQVSAQAQVAYNPTLQVIFFPDFLNGRPEEVSPVTIGTHWGAQGALQLQQIAYNPAFNVGLRAARSSAEFYQLMIEKSKDEILLEVAKLYYGVQVIDKQRDLLAANLAQVASLLRLARLQVDNGLGRQIDVDQLRVNEMNLQNQLNNLDLEEQRQLNLLKFTMQLPLETDLTLTDTLGEDYALPEVALLQPRFQSRVDFAIFDKQQQLHELNLARYKAAYLPSVNLFASLNAQAQPRTFSDFSESRSWASFSTVGLQVNVPIFDGFLKRSQMEQVRIDMLVNAENRRYTQEAYKLQYANARHSLQTNLNNLRALEESRTLAEEVYRVAQNRFREGIAPITEVITAETAMREAQTNYLTALYQVKLSELDLRQINGELLAMVR